jgi:uncharacterized protein YbcI
MTAGGVDVTWELLGKKGQWLGTAFLDDDSDINSTNESINQVEYLILNHDESTRQSQVLLIERMGDDDKSEYTRIGTAEIMGFDIDEEFFSEECLYAITLV